MQIRRQTSARRGSYDQITMINLGPQGPNRRRGSNSGQGRIRRNGLHDISGSLSDAEMRILRRLQGNNRRRRSSTTSPDTRDTELPIAHAQEAEGACARRRSSTVSISDTEKVVTGEDYSRRPSFTDQYNMNSSRRNGKTRRNAICYANATEMFLGAIKDKVSKAKEGK